MPIIQPQGTSQTGSLSPTVSVSNSNHTHNIGDVGGLIGILNAKAEVSHLHNISTIVGLQQSLSTKADLIHTHNIADISGIQDLVNTTISPLATTVAGLVTLTTTHTSQITQILTQLGGNAASKPVIVTAPSITGVAAYGSTLTVSNGSWTNSPTGFFYVWNRKTQAGVVSPISGATLSTYTLVAADAGMLVGVEVTAANSAGGNSLPAASAYTTTVSKPPTVTTNPSISGVYSILQQLTVVNGVWSDNPTFAYQWKMDGVAIAGATGISYTTITSDAGKKVSVSVTGTTPTGVTTVTSTEITIVGIPVNTSVPVLSPSAINIGTLVSCSTGVWTFGPSLTYQWKLDGVDISGATSGTYLTTTPNASKVLSCVVTANTLAGTASVSSNSVTIGISSSGGTLYGGIDRANLGQNANINDCLPFPIDNSFNRIITSYQVSPYNAAFQSIFGGNKLHPDFGGLIDPQPVGESGILYGIQYYVVDGNTQPMVNVTFTTEYGYSFGSESDSGPMPIPPDIQIEGGANAEDRHIIILDKTNKKIYELYRVTKISNNNFMCGSAAIFDMTTNQWRPIGVANEWTSADAAGLPIYPGLVRYEEAMLGPGGIKHAIRFVMNHTRSAYIAPASHIAGTGDSPYFLPMGAKLRLKSSFVINPSWPIEVRAILTAMKDYGMICADNGSSGFFSGAGDIRWNNNVINPIFASIQLSDFEMIDTGTLYKEGHVAVPYPQPPTITTNPSIVSTPRENTWTSVNNGVWTGEVYKYTYQWKLDGVDIPSAVYPSYKPKTTDIGKQLTCFITGLGVLGTLTFTTPAKTVLTEIYTPVAMPTPLPSGPPEGQVSNPVTYAMTGLRTFDIGPGKTYTTPDTFPWHTLLAGDVVNIHYSSTPYNTLITLDAFGTKTNPVIINGVTDANGNRPKFDVSNGCSNASVSAPIYYTTNRLSSDGWRRLGVFNLVVRDGVQWNSFASGWFPEYITFQNLEVCGANSSTNNLITLPDGTTAKFFNGAAFYFLQSRNCTVQNCKIYNNSFGVYTQARTGTAFISVNPTIRNNHFSNNGIVGSYYEHNCYIQGVSPLVEGNYFGGLKPGAYGSAYKSRATGEVFRYNWCESHARAIDMVHCEDWAPVSTVQLDRAYSYMYGNVICNLSTASGYTWSPLHFGGDNTGEDSGSGYEAGLKSPLGYGSVNESPVRYRERLFFYNNTYLTGGSDQMGSQFFDLSLMGGNVSPNDNGYVHDRTTVDAWNNAFYSGSGGVNTWLQYAGSAQLYGSNNIDGTVNDMIGYPAEFVAEASNRLDIAKYPGITTNPSGFNNFASFDYTPTSSSTLRNRGVDDFQATFTWTQTRGVQHYNVEFMPRIRSNGMSPRTIQDGTIDIGAIEYIDPTKPVCSSRPTITGTIATTGNILTCSTGTWNLTCSYVYQWKRNGVAIAGATASTYTTTATDDKTTITCLVYATNSTNTAYIKANIVYIGTPTIMINYDYSYGSAPGTTTTTGGTSTPTAVAPSTILGPDIIGNNYVGQEVWAMPGIYTNGVATITYTWMRSGTAIANATARNYTLTSADIGNILTVSVKAINSAGDVTVVSSTFQVYATATGVIDPNPDGCYTFDKANGTYASTYGFTGYGSSYIVTNSALAPVPGTGAYGGSLNLSQTGNYTRIDAIVKSSRPGTIDLWLATDVGGATGGAGVMYQTNSFAFKYAGNYYATPNSVSKSADTYYAITLWVDTIGNKIYASGEGEAVRVGTTYYYPKTVGTYAGAGLIPAGVPEADAGVYTLRIK